VTVARPSWKQLTEDIAQRKAEVASCVAKKRAAPGPIAITLDAVWDDETRYVIITPTAQPKSPAIEACIKPRMEALLKRHYGMRLEGTMVRARVSFRF
jgi:hypothetical protein